MCTCITVSLVSVQARWVLQILSLTVCDLDWHCDKNCTPRSVLLNLFDQKWSCQSICFRDGVRDSSGKDDFRNTSMTHICD